MESFQTRDGCCPLPVTSPHMAVNTLSSGEYGRQEAFSLNPCTLSVEENQACDANLPPVEFWISTPCISQSQHWTLASPAFNQVVSLLYNTKIQWNLVSNFPPVLVPSVLQIVSVSYGTLASMLSLYLKSTKLGGRGKGWGALQPSQHSATLCCPPLAIDTSTSTLGLWMHSSNKYWGPITTIQGSRTEE